VALVNESVVQRSSTVSNVCTEMKNVVLPTVPRHYGKEFILHSFLHQYILRLLLGNMKTIDLAKNW